MVKGFAEFSMVATVLEQPKGVKTASGAIYVPLVLGQTEQYGEESKDCIYTVSFFNSGKSELAKTVAKSLSQGDTVVVQGRLASNKSKDGKHFTNLVGRTFKRIESKSNPSKDVDAFEDVPF